MSLGNGLLTYTDDGNDNDNDVTFSLDNIDSSLLVIQDTGVASLTIDPGSTAVINPVAGIANAVSVALAAITDGINIFTGEGQDAVTFSSGFSSFTGSDIDLNISFGDDPDDLDPTNADDLDDTLIFNTAVDTKGGDLTINLGSDDDTLTFNAAVTTEGGNFKVNETIAEIDVRVLDDDSIAFVEDFDYGDTVTFNSNVSTVGAAGDGSLFVTAETITVSDAVILDSGNNDLTLNAVRLGTAELENLSPIVINDFLNPAVTKTAKLTIGSGAKIEGKNIILKAQAEDQSFLEQLENVPSTVGTFVLEPLADSIADFASLPFKVLFKASDASVNVNNNAQILGTAGVTISAVATSNSSGKASNDILGADVSPLAIGYTEASASAIVNVNDGVIVDAGEAVVVEADGTAIAKMESSVDETPGDKFALGLGVAVTDIVSKATVAETATITAGRTANISATGSNELEASGEAEDEDNGIIGFGFGLGFTTTDIQTNVDGTVTANQEDGSVVKIEIDPTESDPTKSGYIDFDPAVLPEGITGSTIRVGDNALATGDSIVYSSRRGTTIGLNEAFGGLVDGEEYFVIRHPDDPELIFLASSELEALRGNGLDLGNDSDRDPDDNDIRVDAGKLNTKTFDPNGTFGDAPLIDADADTITLNNDFLVNGSLLESTFELGQAVKYKVGENGTAIGGLEDDGIYYVIASTAENNLEGDNRFVDRQIIGLAETENEARAGIAIDIDPTVATGAEHTLSALHVIDSGLATGVGVIAELETSESITGSTSIGSSSGGLPSPEDIGKSVADNLFSFFSGQTYDENVNKTGSQAANSSLDTAGSFALAITDNTVQANVGGTADLNSREDLEVVATIADELQLNAESDIDADTGAAANNALSAAVSVGVFDNTAEATINEGAELDGTRATRVISDISYPFLTRPDEYIPTNTGEFVDLLKTEGTDAVENYFDGTLGLQTTLFNTWARSTAQAEELGVAGAVNYLEFNNTSNAVVKSGTDVATQTKINQDVDFRLKFEDLDTPPSDWTANQTSSGLTQTTTNGSGIGMVVDIAVDDSGVPVVTLIDEGSGYEEEDTVTFADPLGIGTDLTLTIKFIDESVVSIEATNYMQLVNLTGVFDLFDINTKDPGFSLISDGSSSERGGFGGAFFLQFLTNNTNSLVESGAAIYSGADGGFNMKAEEAILNFNFSQAGTKADKFALGGTFTYVEQTSNTLAQLASDVEVTGRDVNIYAGNLETHINWSGGVAASKNFGFGASVAINNITRNVDAVIGNLDNGGASGTATNIDVAEDIAVLAKTDGALWAFSIAGTLPSGDEQPSSGSNNFGLGISADVSLNILNDNVNAYIHDAGSITAANVGIDALNDVDLNAFSGAAAFVATSGTSIGLAGSYSQNTSTGATRAYIRGKAANGTKKLALKAGDVSVKADRKGDLITGSVTASVAAGQSLAATLAGNVAFNDIDNTTAAFIVGVGDTETDPNTNEVMFTATAANVTVEAVDTSSIFAFGGALAASFGNKAGGIGVAFASNEIISNTQAYLDETTLQATDNITVTADAALDIQALTVSGAGAGSFSGNVEIAGAAAITLNEISGATSASISNSSAIAGAVALTVAATDKSKIIADGGGFALAFTAGNVSGAVGASVAANTIGTTLSATIDDSTVDASGAVSVTATSETDIDVLSIGGAFTGTASDDGLGLALAGAGAAAVNIIDNTILAAIQSGADVNADGDITVKAEDISNIVADAGGVAVSYSLTTSGGLSAAVSVGASVAINSIGDTNHSVRAIIDNATVNSTNGNVDLTANSEAKIQTLSIAGAAAVGAGGGPGLVLTGTAAGALSDNSINATTEASITNGSDVDAGDSVNLTATQTSTISGNAGAVATGIGASFSLYGGAATASIGASYITNTIGNTVITNIDNSDVDAENNVTQTTMAESDIDALAIAGTFSAGGAALSLSVAGAGMYANNTISNLVEASITGNATVTAKNGKVDLSASDKSDIKADGGAVALALGAGLGGAAIVAAGGAISNNTIDENNKVRAYIDNADVDAGTDIEIDAMFDANIDAVALAGGFAVSIAGGAAAAAAGVGVSSTNTINGTTEAYITQATDTITAGDNVSLSAIDATSITAFGAGAALSAAATPVIGSFAGSLGRAVVNNTVNGQVRTYIGAPGTADATVVVASAGSITLTADSKLRESDVDDSGKLLDPIEALLVAELDLSDSDSSNATIKAVAVAASGAFATGASLADGGAESINTVNKTVESFIGRGITVTADGDIDVLTDDTSTIISDVGALAAAAGVEAAAIGTSNAENTINNDISAYVGELAQVTSNGGAIDIIATSAADSSAKSLSAAGAVGFGGALSGAQATSTGTPTTKAYVSAGADINNAPTDPLETALDITVQAVAANTSQAETGSLALGFAVQGISEATATASGVTEAYIESGLFEEIVDTPASILDKTTITGGGLTVQATSEDNAIAEADAITGGLLSIQTDQLGAEATATASPFTTAYVGENVTIVVTGDVTISAEGEAEADSDTDGTSIGGINVGGSLSKSTVDPTINSYIGKSDPASTSTSTSGTTITAGGDVTIAARSGKQDETTTGSFIPLGVDGTAGTTDDQVDTDNDTLTVTGHRLSDGDTITYENNDNASISGLEEEVVVDDGTPSEDDITALREYNVLVESSDTIKLGVAFDAASDIDAATNTITFSTAHNLQTGDAIKYDGPDNISTIFADTALTEADIFYVRVIDNFTIKLASSLAQAENELSSFNPSTAIAPEDPNDTNSPSVITLAGHTFSDGDAVTYRAPNPQIFTTTLVDLVDANDDGIPDRETDGSLTIDDDANTIYIPSHGFVNGDVLVYSTSGDELGGLNPTLSYVVANEDSDFIQLALESDPNTVISLDPSLGADATHFLRKATDEPIGGLTDGVTYYVVESDTNAGTFQLASMPGGGGLTLDTAGLDSDAHGIGVEGLDLNASTGEHELRIDLSSKPAGVHQILGSGGQPLGLSTPSVGDGASGTTATGSAGSLVGISENSATITATPTVQAYVDADRITADGSVEITSDSISNLTADSDNSSGGGATVDEVKANINLTNTNNAFITNRILDGQKIEIKAGENFILSANTDNTANAGTDAEAGSGFAFAKGRTNIDVDYDNTTKVGEFADITAGKNLAVQADSKTDVFGLSDVNTEGFGTDSDPQVDIDVSEGGSVDTTVEIGGGAQLTGNTVAIESQVSKLDVTARAKSSASAAGADSDANTDLDVNSEVTTTIKQSEEGVEFDLPTTITANQGADIQALHQNVNTFADSDASFFGGGGDTDANANNNTTLTVLVDTESPEIQVNVGPRVDGGPLETSDEVDNLALYVEAANISPSIIADADRDVDSPLSNPLFKVPPIDFGSTNANANPTLSGKINWDANVGTVPFTGTERVLEIDENGQIVTAEGITVNGGQSGGVIADSDDISVDYVAIPAGDIVFKADNDVFNDDEFGVVPTFSYTFPNESVTITNNSDKNLILNDIYGAGNSTQPDVLIDQSVNPTAFKFNIDLSDLSDFEETPITITNNGASDVFLNGRILNPISTTTITNNGGGILASNTGNVVQSNILDLDATDDLGTDDDSRINVQLVDSTAAPLDVDADAGSDVYLKFQGLLREDSATAHTINLDGITAGDDIDLELEESLQQSPVGNSISGVNVEVVNTPALDGVYFSFFQPETPPANPIVINVDIYDAGGTPIETTYELGDSAAGTAGLIAGDSITIVAPDAEESVPVNVTGLIDTDTDSDSTGSLTVNVDGDVDLTEISGSLTVEEVVSTAGSIALTLPDTSTVGEDLLMDGGLISAGGDVTLLVGDNFVAEATTTDSTISAGGNVLIEVDSGDADDGVGGGVAFVGSIEVGDTSTNTITVSGDTDDDNLYFADTTTNVGMTINGDAGADAIVSGNNDDFISGGIGNDEIGIGLGNNTVEAGADNDLVYSLNSEITGDNTIDLGEGDNKAWMQAGNNNITGGTGADEIGIGLGNDIVNAGEGNDLVYDINGGGGVNTINLGEGLNKTYLLGGAPGDTNIITGGGSRDEIGIGLGNDTVIGNGGDDFIYVTNEGGGVNNITTGDGNDVFELGDGTDTVDAGDGDNIIYLSKNATTGGSKDITTGSGNDFVDVGSGNDVINLGTNDGFDVAIGRGGGEIYVLNEDMDADTGFLEVKDFVQSDDTLQISGGFTFSDLTIEVVGGDTRITLTATGDQLAILKNFTDTLTADDFRFLP